MQPRLTVGILVLQAEGLVCAIRYLGFLFQTDPAGVVAKPNQVAVLVGHLSWDADLIAVGVVGLLSTFAVCGCPIAVGIGVEIGIPAVRLDFLQEVDQSGGLSKGSQPFLGGQ
ncbi:hypothetical protein HMPREF2972_08230 [Neisseria sp. HMSC066B07]|nr:hypothetical protein HMPREF2972_08230 [Neisseria sp. HMSC066B07]